MDMKLYDIHTHHLSQNESVVSIVSRNAGEHGSFCGLNLQYQLYSLGLHPWKIRVEEVAKNIDYIEKNAIFDSIKAIGECGLDHLCDTPLELQRKVFFAQIRISENLSKPLIIHCVKAFDELIALKKDLKPKQCWIIHGFRGNPQQMKQLLNQDFFLSFGAKFNEETVQKMLLEKMFLETDDSGSEIGPVYQQIASARKMSLPELADQIQKNYLSYFR